LVCRQSSDDDSLYVPNSEESEESDDVESETESVGEVENLTEE